MGTRGQNTMRSSWYVKFSLCHLGPTAPPCESHCGLNLEATVGWGEGHHMGSLTRPMPAGRAPGTDLRPSHFPARRGNDTRFAQSQRCEGTWNQEGESPIHKFMVFINHRQRHYPRSQLQSSISCRWWVWNKLSG